MGEEPVTPDRVTQATETLEGISRALYPVPRLRAGFDAALSVLVEENERLRDKAALDRDLCRNEEEQREAAEARVEALTEALRFYADERRYEYDEDCCYMGDAPTGVLEDIGDVARAALDGKENP